MLFSFTVLWQRMIDLRSHYGSQVCWPLPPLKGYCNKLDATNMLGNKSADMTLTCDWHIDGKLTATLTNVLTSGLVGIRFVTFTPDKTDCSSLELFSVWLVLSLSTVGDWLIWYMTKGLFPDSLLLMFLLFYGIFLALATCTGGL